MARCRAIKNPEADVSESSQRRALKTYRKRLSQRGIARFEVLARRTDRELIRSLARVLSKDDPKAKRIRESLKRLAGEPPSKGGILEKPAGKKRRELEQWFVSTATSLFANRVLPFDDRAGLIWARPIAEGTARGRPRSPLDMIIAAVAEANDCTLVTDNTEHLIGLKTLNPMRSEA
jgi:predicted nucleic acid-binding protein